MYDKPWRPLGAMAFCMKFIVFRGIAVKRKMESEMNLPNSFVSITHKYGIEKSDIIFAATADFDADYRFADSVVALTKDKLVLAAYPYVEKTVRW